MVVMITMILMYPKPRVSGVRFFLKSANSFPVHFTPIFVSVYVKKALQPVRHDFNCLERSKTLFVPPVDVCFLVAHDIVVSGQNIFLVHSGVHCCNASLV